MQENKYIKSKDVFTCSAVLLVQKVKHLVLVTFWNACATYDSILLAENLTKSL